MKRKRNAVVVAAALLAASFSFDSYVAAAIKSIQTPQLTASVTLFDNLFVWIYLALLAATMAVVAKGKLRENKTRSIFALAASIITTIAAVYLLKFIFQRERPGGGLVETAFGVKDYAFPSAHVASAAAAAVSSPAALRIPWAIFTVAALFSRVYLNMHFLSDTAGGLIVAFAVSALLKNKLKKGIAAQDKTEIRRQIIHAIVGIAIAAFVWKYSQLWYVVLVVAAPGLVLSHIIKSARATKNAIIKKFRKLAVATLALVERKEELERFPGKGAIMLFAGAGITTAIFRKEAVAAIVILAVGDSVSHLAGRFFGKTNHKWLFAQEKTVEGSIAGFVCAAAAAATILPVWMAIAAAAAGVAVEALHLRIGRTRIDDNLIVPVAAAAALWALL